MGFSYFIPTRILFGPGKLEELSRQSLPGKKALIVISSGGSMIRHGYLDRVRRQLELGGAAHVLFDKILPNPVKAHVMEGAALARSTGCDFVVGLGGGSSIDSAKSIAVMAVNSGDYWDYVKTGTGGKKPLERPPLPIVAITTTAGTGTEADPWTVITNEETNEKVGFGSDATFPCLSVVDPELMVSVPPALTAFQGFDALFHSTEGLLNPAASEASDLYALEAVRLVGHYLPRAVRNGGDLEAREKVALANTLSGFVQCLANSTSAHAMEHVLSAYHPALPHGAGLLMLADAYYRHFAEAGVCGERFVSMARALGNSNADKPLDFLGGLADLASACGVDGLRMSGYGVRREDMAAYAASARAALPHMFASDPAPLSQEEAAAIMDRSYR